MSNKTSHKTLRTCTASDGSAIAKGETVELTPDEVRLWAQDGKIAKPSKQSAAPEAFGTKK